MQMHICISVCSFASFYSTFIRCSIVIAWTGSCEIKPALSWQE